MTPAFHAFLISVTGLGDSGVLMLIVLGAAVYLAFCGCGRGALALMIAFVAASGGVGLAKLILLGCRAGYYDYGIHSPSGHTALSLAVYATLATLLASQMGKRAALFLRAIAFTLIAAIAFSRVFLTYHSVGEVIVGIAIGGAAFALARLFLFHNRRRVPPFEAVPLLLAIAAAAFILHGTQLPAENFIRQLAEKMKLYIPFCGN